MGVLTFYAVARLTNRALSNKGEVQDKDDHHRPHEGIDFTPTSFDGHGDRIKDKTNGQAFRNAVSQ